MRVFARHERRPSPTQRMRRLSQSRVVRWSGEVFKWLERLSRHKATMCLLFMAMTMGARSVLLRRIPIPQPHVSDEFGYLLEAETFALGRLTNPTHPMWVHFETFHELMRPTYMSKFPPGQALFLAMGWKLLGHPWFGVLISYGLFAGCLCWMLQNWVPPVYAAIGTGLILARISIFGYWMNSYWGGAVAASAGCLLLGALPRLARRVRSKDVLLAAIGLVLLANTRPFEGLVMSTAAVSALLFWRWRRRRSLAELFSLRCALPLLLVCGAGALLDGYYNHRVTGKALLMPYVAYMQQYQIASPWIVFPARTPPVYRHVDLQNSWANENLAVRQKRANPLPNLRELRNVFSCYCSPLCLFPVALGLLLSGSYRVWMVATICFCVWCGFLVESSRFPHYIAGSAGLIALLAIYGLRALRVIGRDYGPALVLTLVTLLCAQGRAQDQGLAWEVRRDPSPRMIAMRAALKWGGRHLILVRHSPDYIEHNDECVYNGADIDAQQVVWARDMGQAKNQELIDYYRGSRKVWLYQPDSEPTKLLLYESVSP